MVIIPLQPVPSQIISVSLDSQACQIAVTQRATGLYCDVYVDDASIVTGVICETNNVIVRSAYLGFSGDIAFMDLQPDDAHTDPFYAGLGSRFFLAWFAPDELPMGLA